MLVFADNLGGVIGGSEKAYFLNKSMFEESSFVFCPHITKKRMTHLEGRFWITNF